MDEKSIEVIKLLREHPEKALFPGALLTSKGEQNYIGSAFAIAGTLFFNDAHTPEVRRAICECFEEYEVVASEHLTWVWREEPPDGPDKMNYKKAKPMREMMGRMKENDSVSFGYISGKKPEDSGEWEFQVSGLRAWKAKMGTWGLCSLSFSMPILHVLDKPTAFQAMFVSFAKRLKAVHGYGGPALVLSLVRSDENEPFEAHMSGQIKGLDVGHHLSINRAVVAGIKTVGWLTAINHDMVKQIGGLSTIRSELPMDWFALYDYGNGLVIQAGPKASAAAVSVDPKPAIYVLPNMLLKEVRTPDIGWLHSGSTNGEPRIIGVAADAWLKRFDVPDAELPDYKTKLLKEPKLTEATTLPDRL